MKNTVLLLAVFITLAFQSVVLGQETDNDMVPSKWIVENPVSSQWLINITLPKDDRQIDTVSSTFVLRNDMKLRDKNLYGVKIKGRKLQNVDFSGSKIENADFSHTVFIRCNFSKTWINNVITDEKTEFIDCKFDDAQVHHFDYTKFPAEISKALLEKKIDFTYNNQNTGNHYYHYYPLYPDVYYKGVDPSENYANVEIKGKTIGLSKDQLRQTVNYQDGILNGLIFSGVYNCDVKQFEDLDYTELDLSNMIVSDVMFLYIDFKNANFEDAKLINVEMSKTKNLTAEQIKSTWNWKNHAMYWFPKSTLDYFKIELGLDLTENIVNK